MCRCNDHDDADILCRMRKDDRIWRLIFMPRQSVRMLAAQLQPRLHLPGEALPQDIDDGFDLRPVDTGSRNSNQVFHRHASSMSNTVLGINRAGRTCNQLVVNRR